MKYILCFAILNITLTTAFGQSHWYVSPSGNDNNPGTFSAPFKSIPVAIEAAEPGDEILLRNGNYTSNEIRIGKSNLTIHSYPGEWAVITATTDVEDITSCIWYDEPDVEGGVLENLEIVGGALYGISFETNWEWGVPDNERHGASNITIRNCRIHHTGRDCIKIKPGCDGIQVLNCEIHHSGIGIFNSPDNGGPNAEGIDNVNGANMLVRGCYFHDISTSGVYAKGGARNCLIEENLFVNIGEGGILLGFYTDADYFDTNVNPEYYECLQGVARNNIVLGTGGAGIGLWGARDCQAYNNTVVTASPAFHAPLHIAKAEVYVNDNYTATPPCRNIQVFNNIFIDQSGNGEEDHTVQVRDGALAGVNLINNNIYYKTAGPAQFDDNVHYPALSFNEWKSTFGFDQQSIETNPGLDAQYHLAASSPALDAGRAVAGIRDYDGALRSGPLDIGADEYEQGIPLTVPPPPGTIGTGVNQSVGTVEPAVFDFEVFPNPVSDMLTIRSYPAHAIVFLSDASGKVVKMIFSEKVKVADLPAGHYFLSLITENGISSKTIEIR